MIDQIIPRYLTTNEDERLVGEGAMIQAHNVSFVEDGEGTAFILKNAKGTIAATANSAGDQILDGHEVRVVGSVSDDQRGFIYFFVCGITSADDHGIYQYNTSDNTYKKVFRNSWLNFTKDTKVKADVINRNFQQDNNLQSIIYFTDNVNPPRKINVDRALAGDYDFSSNNSRDHALGAIKAPLISAPTFTFQTDYSIKVNNFAKSLFQFTTQLVYKDGEESALSPYSKVAVASNVGLEGLDDPTDLSGSSFLIDNQINVSIPYDSLDEAGINIRPEVSLIRLYGRNTNDGVWLLLDEFDPENRVERNIYGTTRVVYEPSTRIYKFYNEGVYSAASDTLKNKTYDNVPLKAEGQTIAGNRLMYSNYVEGRANVTIPEGDSPHSLTVLYNDISDGAVTLDGSSESADMFDYLNQDEGEIEFDFAQSENYTTVGTAVPNASVVDFKVKMNPRWIQTGGATGLPANDTRFKLHALAKVSNATLFGVDNDAIPDYALQGLGIDFRQAFGDFGPNTNNANLIENESADEDSLIVLDKQFVVGTDKDVSDVLDDIKAYVEGVEKEVEYACSEVSAQVLWEYSELTNHTNPPLGEDAATPAIGDGITLNGLRFKILWGLTAIKSGTKITINPYPKKIKWTEVAAGNNDLPTEYQAVYPIRNSDQEDLQTTHLAAALQEWDTDGDGNFSIDDAIFTSLSLSAARNSLGRFNIAYIDPAPAAAEDEYLQDPFIQIEQKTSILSFKAGANHTIGVVYYDKYGRHGFVNKIGQFYVKSLGERSGSQGKGAATAQIQWNHDAPDWAAMWSIVYPGNSSFSSWTQYTTGAAFVPIKDDNDTPDTQKKRVYVSFNTLDKFKSDKSPAFDYSFTKGDKLRVVSYRNADNDGNVYPGSDYPFEFNVVDVVTLGDTENPLRKPAEGENTVDDLYKGTFLVLDAPNINGGAVDEEGDQIKYFGFDWNSVAKTQFSSEDIEYPDGSNANGTNRWNQEVLVEIVTPKQVEPTVYYETGVFGAVENYGPGATTNHGPDFVFSGGEVHLRTRSCVTKEYDSSDSSPNGWGYPGENLPADYVFRNKSVEAESASDYFDSDSWDRGKPHASFERAAEVRRYNGITYSDAYEEDVSNLSLSSFNASLANFSSLDSKFGAARSILNYDNDLLILQENKVSRANVSKDILRTASGQGLVSLSTQVIGPPTYYQGDYGVGNHPEAILLYDGDLFFADASRRKILRFNPSAGGVIPISDTDVSSLFDDEFKLFEDATGTKRIVSGYDPRTNCYYVSLGARDDSGYNGRTISYDMKMRKWRSTYSFFPDVFANQNRSMYSCRYVNADTDTLFHRHEDTDAVDNRNTFYGGSTSESVVEVVSKVNPHMPKVFNALSFEGTEAWSAQIVSQSGQDTGSGNMDSSTFEEKEGQFYRSIPGDQSSSSTSHYHHIGKISSIDGNVVTLEKSIARTPIVLNMIAQVVDSGAFVNASSGADDLSRIASTTLPNKVTLDSGATISQSYVGKELYYKTKAYSDGDKIRGHYAKIKMTNTSSDLIELFSVNTHYTNSRPNHALGQ